MDNPCTANTGRKDVILQSTSFSTADATPIIMEETRRKRLQFIPKLIDNPHDKSRCVEGKIVYEKKPQNELPPVK